MLLENAIVEPVSDDVKWFPERAIYLGLDFAGRAVFMPLLTKTRGPQAVSMTDLENALADNVLRISSSVRPALRSPSDLSKRSKKEYDFWEPYFRELLSGERRDELLDETVRFNLIAKVANDADRPEISVRRMFYRVLRAGRHLYGLCNDFNKRGCAGKKQNPGTKKRGRKPKVGGIASNVPAHIFRGRIEDAVIDRVIGRKESIPGAYRKMLAESFSDKITEPNGKVRVEILPESECPTLRQFRSIAQDLMRKGVRKTRINPVKAKHGTAKDGVLGPGYRYEIDATGGQLELVSEFNLEQSIGPANAYGLIDVWSTACVGGAMGVFNASYQAAQMALFNTFTSKKDLCERWGIDIEEEVWPCHHVPKFITSDRGELVSDASEALPSEFNTIMQVAPPYTPEAKGTIEGWFHGLKSGDIRKLVGFGKKMERMQRDPKMDAALTRYDAMKAFLLLAIKYNLQAAPARAIPPEMLQQGYERISRITLWQWGMRNLIPCARIEDPGFIFTSLLRKSDASIRENGLFVQGVRYMSPDLRTSGLLRRAAEYGAIAVQATIDDFHGNMIWYRQDLDAPWKPAYLADEKLKIYNATFEELVEYYRKVKLVNERSKVSGALQDLHIETSLVDLSENAVQRKKSSTGSSNTKKKGSRAARVPDSQNERREHGSAVLGSYVDSAKKSKPMNKQGRAETKPDSAGQADISNSRLDLVKGLFLKKAG